MGRKVIPALFVALLASCAGAPGPERAGFVRADGMRFMRDGKPYRFVGANLWYGANLGAVAEGGNRERLVRELDLLRSLGVDNLRVLGVSEGNAQPNTVRPALQPRLGELDERLLDGLDFLLAQMAKRDMVAVIYLTNYWEWSGGMAQYVSWLDGEPFPNPFFAQYSWPQFMEFSARFYGHEGANAAYRRVIETLVTRTNEYSGISYRDDPTIMAWQLANEPRPGAKGAGQASVGAFNRWVGETAVFIRSLDSNHLVSTGNEGTLGCLGSADTYIAMHRFEAIDYVTAHLWAFNWGWYDPLRPEVTFPRARENAIAYMEEHAALAGSVGKPLVLEEFGIPRDGHSYSPEATTTTRDAYYELVFQHILDNARAGGPFAGSNFWAWGGYGRARETVEAVWQPGDGFTGDPPQEPQGRNSVFATDSSTLAVVEEHAARIKTVR